MQTPNADPLKKLTFTSNMLENRLIEINKTRQSINNIKSLEEFLNFRLKLSQSCLDMDQEIRETLQNLKTAQLLNRELINEQEFFNQKYLNLENKFFVSENYTVELKQSNKELVNQINSQQETIINYENIVNTLEAKIKKYEEVEKKNNQEPKINKKYDLNENKSQISNDYSNFYIKNNKIHDNENIIINEKILIEKNRANKNKEVDEIEEIESSTSKKDIIKSHFNKSTIKNLNTNGSINNSEFNKNLVNLDNSQKYIYENSYQSQLQEKRIDKENTIKSNYSNIKDAENTDLYMEERLYKNKNLNQDEYLNKSNDCDEGKNTYKNLLLQREKSKKMLDNILEENMSNIKIQIKSKEDLSEKKIEKKYFQNKSSNLSIDASLPFELKAETQSHIISNNNNKASKKNPNEMPRSNKPNFKSSLNNFHDDKRNIEDSQIYTEGSSHNINSINNLILNNKNNCVNNTKINANALVAANNANFNFNQNTNNIIDNESNLSKSDLKSKPNRIIEIIMKIKSCPETLSIISQIFGEEILERIISPDVDVRLIDEIEQTIFEINQAMSIDDNNKNDVYDNYNHNYNTNNYINNNHKNNTIQENDENYTYEDNKNDQNTNVNNFHNNVQYHSIHPNQNINTNNKNKNLSNNKNQSNLESKNFNKVDNSKFHNKTDNINSTLVNKNDYNYESPQNTNNVLNNILNNNSNKSFNLNHNRNNSQNGNFQYDFLSKYSIDLNTDKSLVKTSGTKSNKNLNKSNSKIFIKDEIKEEIYHNPKFECLLRNYGDKNLSSRIFNNYSKKGGGFFDPSLQNGGVSKLTTERRKRSKSKNRNSNDISIANMGKSLDKSYGEKSVQLERQEYKNYIYNEIPGKKNYQIN